MVQDGQYIDADTKKVYLTMATYNTRRSAFGYTEVTCTWQAAGDVQVAVQIATKPTVPYVFRQHRSAKQHCVIAR